jgi:hypothetical protein
MGETMRLTRNTNAAFPEGDDLGSASVRGDTLRAMLRERGYTNVIGIVTDLLASVAVEEQRERAEWVERTQARGAMVRASRLHTLTPEDVANDALAEVKAMVGAVTE